MKKNKPIAKLKVVYEVTNERTVTILVHQYPFHINPIGSKLITQSSTMIRKLGLLIALAALLPSTYGLSNMSKVKHVVMFTLQDDVSEDKVQGRKHFLVASFVFS